jgi:hypothetical protein
MSPLKEWSMPRVVTTAWAWVACILVVAFLTPTGRFLLQLNAQMRAAGTTKVELPIDALRAWFVLTPLCAFVPPFVLLFVWWRTQKGAASHRST